MECKVKDLSIEYEEMGVGKPIVILHKSHIAHFESLFKKKEGWKRIYVNYPGIGHSEVKDWVKSADDILDILLDFIDSVVGKEQFLLMGFSYSCYLVRGILYKRRLQVDGIAMLCPVIVPDMEERAISEGRLYFKDEKFLSSLSDDEAEGMNYFVVQNQRVWDRANALEKEVTTTFNREFYNQLKKSGKYGYSFNVDEMEEPFTKPALIILGRQDYVVGYKDAWRIIDNYPRGTFTILDMAGHGIQYEQQYLCDIFIKDWLDRVESDVAK